MVKLRDNKQFLSSYFSLIRWLLPFTVVLGIFVFLKLGFVFSQHNLPIVNTIGKVLPVDAAPLKYQTYRFMRDEPTSLDVSANLYVGEWNEFLFETLVVKDENGDLIPAAAESWEVSSDGTSWTFHLRKTGRWSDGRPVTAHDFVSVSYTHLTLPTKA